MPKRSRKRPRTDAISENIDPPDTIAGNIQVEEPIVRDGMYYREDGDCAILVGRVLFKIHRVFLARDASAFANMFSIPQGNADSQTGIDENPLILYDDVDDFRALCWIIYALPTEYSQQHVLATANIQNLVSLYLIAQKYHFEAHETFARDLLRDHCQSLKSRSLSKLNYFRKCPETRLRTLLRIATLTEQTLKSGSSDSFPSVLQNIWIHRLRDTKDSISMALEVGETLGLRGFVAELYYLELTRTKPVLIEGSTAYAPLVTDLAPHQILALYQGNWSLRHYWSKTRKMALKKEFECVPDIHSCNSTWEQSWSYLDYIKWETTPFDPINALTTVCIEIESELDCACATKVINDMTAELRNSLADHFLGPLPASMPDAESLS